MYDTCRMNKPVPSTGGKFSKPGLRYTTGTATASQDSKTRFQMSGLLF
jgi:hypothetical protein